MAEGPQVMLEPPGVANEEATALDAVRRGDAAAFVALAERYRRQLHVHCYRMLGSVEDAEDLVQETMLRAWRGRVGFEGRSVFRTWLYRIATNACLNALERRPRRITSPEFGPAGRDPHTDLIPSPELPWLQPYPDHLLEPTAPTEAEPEAIVVTRETIELSFLAAIQHLPPRQRAILILRDVLGWSAHQSADLLDTSVAAVKSSLQRARATMRRRLPPRRLDWASASALSDEERVVLRRYMEVYERQDAAALIALLREDARQTMPPVPTWFDGRDMVIAVKTWWFGPAKEGDFRVLPTAANRQPAAAIYLRRHGDDLFRLVAMEVLRIEDGLIVEIDSFLADLIRPFDLPVTV
jgi:RNA polymerase sigma-70 factor (ECF subfamily)